MAIQETLQDNANTFFNRMGDSIVNSAKTHVDSTKDAYQSQIDTLSTITNVDTTIKTNFTNWGSAKGDDGKLNLRGINTNFKDKLQVSCPAFSKICGQNTIDFGNMFMSSSTQNSLNAASGLVSDGLAVTQTLIDTFSPETYNAVLEALQFVVTDAIEQSLNYLEKTMTTYVSPNYALSLTKQFGDVYARELKDQIKDPKDILKEILDSDKYRAESLSPDEAEALKQVANDFKTKFAKTVADANKWFQDLMVTIEPYRSEIMKYMQYGPEFAIGELENLYKKYLNKGIDYVDSKVKWCDTEIKKQVNGLAIKSADKSAMLINDKILKKTEKLAKEANTKKVAIEIKAKAAIKKALLKIMATFGG